VNAGVKRAPPPPTRAPDSALPDHEPTRNASSWNGCQAGAAAATAGAEPAMAGAEAAAAGVGAGGDGGWFCAATGPDVSSTRREKRAETVRIDFLPSSGTLADYRLSGAGTDPAGFSLHRVEDHAARASPRCRARRPLPEGGRGRLGGPRRLRWEKSLLGSLVQD